jgi:glycosyltransferase involved in cell wall biosynthesis
MNLLFISNVYPTPVAPTKGVFNSSLARALAAGHRVRVIAPVPWTEELVRSRRGLFPPARAEIRDGVPVYYPRYYYPPRVLRSAYGWFYWRSIRRVARELIGAERPDVVLTFWAHPDGEAAVRAARECGAPVVSLVGGSDVLMLTRHAGRRARVANVLRSSDAVVAVSRDLAVKIQALGVAPEKVSVWSRGIDSSIFCPGSRAAARERLGMPPDVPALLWVGRMVPVKGLDVLLTACADLQKRGTDFHLYLVGGGELRRSLEQRARAQNLTARVSFVGERRHAELADWYRAADLTLLPSLSEGVPNVLRESLACGTPFVASRVGGIPEIATEPWAHLVPPGDPAALAGAVGAALAASAPDQLPAPRSDGWAEAAAALVRILEPLTARWADRPRARGPHAVCR